MQQTNCLRSVKSSGQRGDFDFLAVGLPIPVGGARAVSKTQPTGSLLESLPGYETGWKSEFGAVGRQSQCGGRAGRMPTPRSHRQAGCLCYGVVVARETFYHSAKTS